MPKANKPRRVAKYPDEFKATAVALSHLPNVEVQGVAHSLDIHPFMLSRWRKQVRDGEIVAKKKQVLSPEVEAELKELRQLKKDYKQLQMEHDLLKKAIEFTSKKRQMSSNSSTPKKK